MKKLKIIFLLILIIIPISSVVWYRYYLEWKNGDKYFVVIPHHNLVNQEIDEFYKKIKNDYKNIKNIVIISPNHFTSQNFTINKKWKYCYKLDKNDCLKIRNLDDKENSENISSFETKDWYIETKEHGITNHFKFINKYFKRTKNYAILLRIKTKKDDYLKNLVEKLNNYNFFWDTLFIASVDFSHHVNEKMAVFHDVNTLNYLNSWIERPLEVDCPNCLFLIKDLASKNNKNYINISDRTSVDKKLWINSNYDNTSHIYWKFEDKDYKIEGNIESSFSGSYMYSKFEKPFLDEKNKNEITWIFFWDAHFTRGFTYESNPYQIENYLQCFYSNKDLERKNKFWHNRPLYSFDFAGLNLETSVWNKDECEKSSKSIVFQTDPKYLNAFKDIWVNIFNLANNHSYDCGNMWYDATKKYLDEKEFLYFWDGRWGERTVVKKEIYGTKVAFVWFNDIWKQIDIDKKSSLIKELTSDWYLVIVNIHWWGEYKLKSNNRQQNMAQNFIDAWAKLIIWHHPHVVQEYDVYKWVPIIYSLWNFIFDQPFDETLPWYGVVFSINWKWIKYNILKFKRDPKTYKIDCDSFE